jgi:hypothetical protein
MDPHEGYDFGDGRDPFGSFDMYDMGGGGMTGWGMGPGRGVHRGGPGQMGMGAGDMDEYRMHSRGTMPMSYVHPQYLHAQHAVHRAEPVPSQNPHVVRPLHAQEYRGRVEMPLRHREPPPQSQSQSLQPSARPPLHQPQEQARMADRAPAAPGRLGAKRVRDDAVLAAPSESTSSKRSRAEKHYKEIRLLCSALSPHIADVQVNPARLLAAARARARILLGCLPPHLRAHVMRRGSGASPRG